MPEVKRKLPESVKKLIDHLRSTGTGKSKLAHLETIAFASKDGDEFLASAQLAMPAVTWGKIQTYLAEHEGVQMKSPKEVAGRVESRDENQSSLPELTFNDERKAPQLREPGTTKTRQLGGDRVVAEPQGDKAKGDEGQAGDEAESEVADLPADEAKDKISRMTSTEKLEAIVVAEKRVTVSKAAQDRLDELNKK
jgi:hypothetical protein